MRQYFYVKVENHIRCMKAGGPREACRLAFGVIYDRPGDSALYKAIGGRIPRSLPLKEAPEE